MPRAKIITDAKAEKVLREILDSKDKRAQIDAIKVWMERKREKEAQKQTQRDKVTKVIVNDKALQDLIDWHPHEKQLEILNSKNLVKVIAAGKGFGKTSLCAYIALRTLLEKNKKILVVAPSYGLTDRIREYLNQWIVTAFKGEIKFSARPFPTYKTRWGSYIDCRSGEQPTEIQGKAYDLIIVDECREIDRKVYETYIANAAREKFGEFFYIGTPGGRNWFWEIWMREKENNGSFQFTSIDNPYFPKEKWEEYKKKTPELIFRQEYEAEFIKEAIIFKELESCLEDYFIPVEPNPNHMYVIGVDLGRYEDFTAIVVMDLMTNRLADFHHFQGDWGIQKQRIISLIEKYNQAAVYMDATSITVGDAYVQELADAGYNVIGYRISSNIPKRQLVEKTIVLFQNKSIKLSKQAEDLILELKAFTFDITAGGVIRYQAPQGMHDDCVMALCLACIDIEDRPLPELKKGQTEVYKFPSQEF
jgi:hypothetical protein